MSSTKNFPFLLILLFLVVGCNSIEVDFLIEDAMVFDGTMKEPKQTDIGILGDRIVFIGNADKAKLKGKRIIDANGLYLAPGFIDPHTHALSDLNDSASRSLQAWLWQGVTTVMEGNDGSSPFPIGKQLEGWEKAGIGINAGLFVGHGTIREKVIGLEDRTADADEILAMQALVQQAMDEGAFGISTGLFYSPGSYADIEEIISLSETVASNGGIYDTHQRDEGSYGVGLLASVQEVIEIGKRAKIPVHISHIKALGREVWGFSSKVVDLVNEARLEGVEITANQYPYLASKTSLKAAVVPRWAEDGGLEAMMERLNDPALESRMNEEIKKNIYIRGGAGALVFAITDNEEIRGKSLEEVAELLGQSEVEAVRTILNQDPKIMVVSFNMQEDDLRNFMQQEWVMTGSDGGIGHPRKYGTFPKKMREYCFEKNYLTLGEMIHRSSLLTANTLNIERRGMIKEGYFADIILFNPEQIDDPASFENPAQYGKGMVYVFVNGQLAIDEGKYTNVLAGRALRLNQ